MNKKFLVVLLILILGFSFPASFAELNTVEFTDVPLTHWAYEDITFMSHLGIISGYDDHTFLPNNSVSRAEFSKMMVLTLSLDLTSLIMVFADVHNTEWFYTYVETARNYLTGFKVGENNYFRPKEDAVREDMAVAIVLGLGLDKDADVSILDAYEDSQSISTNLKPYVAKAIEQDIMIGNNGNFNPQGTLTRAEAATLLTRLIRGEKIVYDTSVISLNDNFSPSLTGISKDDSVVLEWTQVPSSGFKYYKVVASKYDSTPSYPENGYIQYISNVTNTKIELSPSASINNGDTSKLEPNTYYYFSITAVYESGKYTSNAISITVPGEVKEISNENRTPVLEITSNGDGLNLIWTKVSQDNFKYYKVVFSKSDTSPSYPANGYLTYISNVASISGSASSGESYNGGDIGGELVSGQTYNIAITAVYNDGTKYYTSNVITKILP